MEAFGSDMLASSRGGMPMQSAKRSRVGGAAAAAVLVLLSIIAAPSASAADAAGAKLPPESKKWLRLDARHFTIFSSVDRSATEDIATELETLREVIGQMVKGRGISSPLPTFVYVFAGERLYRPYDEMRATGGFFSARWHGNYVAIKADRFDDRDPLEIVRHEYLHYFASNNIPAAPVWLDEGLAEFYSTLKRRERKVEIGLPIPGDLEWLSRRSPIPLEQLFAVTHSSPEYTEPDRRPGVYATAWLLIHYLFSDESHSAQVAAFFAALDAGQAPDAAIASAFGSSLVDLDAQLRMYAQKMMRSSTIWKIEFETLKVDTTFLSSPVPYPEILGRLGLLLATPGRTADALAHCDAALKLAPESPSALLCEGLARLLDDHRDEAMPFLRRAVDADPDDATTNFIAAKAALGVAIGEKGGLVQYGSGGPAVLEARKWLERAVAATPDHGEARALLGLTYGMIGGAEAAGGIPHLEEAFRLMPTRWDIANNLAGLYASVGRRQDAEKLASRVAARCPDPQVAGAARTLLASLQRGDAPPAPNPDGAPRRSATAPPRPEDPLGAVFTEAMGRLAKKDPDGALALLERVIKEAKDPQLLKVATSTRDEIRTRQYIGRYNEAVQKANAGDVEGALTIMKNVATNAPQPDLRERARKLVEKWSLRQ